MAVIIVEPQPFLRFIHDQFDIEWVGRKRLAGQHINLMLISGRDLDRWWGDIRR